MYDENQTIKMLWNNNNREWYESRGYTGYERYKEFDVKIKDLKESSVRKILVTCDYCGSEFETEFSVIKNGEKIYPKHACPHCSGKKASESSKQKRIKKAFSKMRDTCDQYGYTLITKEEDYTDAHMKVQYECPEHGIQTVPMDSLKNGRQCWYCSYEKRSDESRHDVDYIEHVINSVNDNKLLNKDEYKTSRERNLQIQCKCGKIYTTSFSNFTRSGINRCHSCAQSESVGELRVREYLDSHGIKYIPQYRFDDCKDKKKLPFDFCLPDLNTCIEFDGKYHYMDVRFEGQKDYVEKHDKIKTDYCDNNGINLIRIPYWDYQNIETILDEKLAI